jgi:hypothetical protein
MTFAAVGACAVLAALALFQVLLAAGAPLGRYAWGGRHDGVLPVRFRVGSVLSVLVYAAIALVLLWRADLAAPAPSEGAVGVAAWVVAGYFFVGTVMNALSRSRDERKVMTPTAAALFVLSVAVAVGP